MPALPPWIVAADPAKYEEAGLRIGESRASRAQEGAERDAAGERAQQELMLRQQQLEAQATQAAQKYAAQRQYQDAIAGGADPLQALLKFGPAMGQGAAVGSALHAQQLRQPKPQLPPPAFQTIQGPDGKPMNLLMQNGKIVPPGQYTPKPQVEPEKWQQIKDPDTGVPVQVSTKTGLRRPDPAYAEQQRQQGKPGALSQQARAQISEAKQSRTTLQKKI